MEYHDFNSSENELRHQSIKNHQEMMRVGTKGYCLPKTFKDIASDVMNMELRESDVFVSSYMRSGTTWTQEMVWLIANDLDYEKATAVPITTRFLLLGVYIKHIETIMKPNEHNMLVQGLEAQVEPDLEPKPEMSSLRFFKTHIPLSLLPPKLLDEAKMVYIARDPRDVAVSLFHFIRLVKLQSDTGTFRQFWNAFTKNLIICNPYFEHVKEAWAQRNHPNMLFLFYEELSRDLPGSIRRVAKFLGKALTAQQVERLREHLDIESFRNNASVNMKNLRDIDYDPSETFIRKGKPGNWREYFDDEMTREAERWIKKNLQDTDLRFPSMENEHY